MLFTSPVFLFGFLPAVLLLYAVCPKPLKNGLLLIASLFFYAWGETVFVGLMLASIIVNYALGRWMSKSTHKQWVLSVGIVANLLPLLFFKYIKFIVVNLGFSWPENFSIYLPLGISFFTFQSLSYLIDIYRRTCEAQKNPVSVGLYISFFPQLIAGPIVRYQHIAEQITYRKQSLSLFSSGVERFVFGLAKKMLIANPLGEVADQIFALDAQHVSSGMAWIAIVSYALQIYFDFSAYSDMAIGLARMFGFRFLENFNYPYISRSIREFWQRWHISLSQWFRDYLYIPLGGNRVNALATYRNLLLVFLLCGLWHGASWNFVVWGLLHGSFIIIERLGLGQILDRSAKIFGHVYTLFVVLIAWVFFRIEEFADAMTFLGRLFFVTDSTTSIYSIQYFSSQQYLIAVVAGLVLSTPVYRQFINRMQNAESTTGLLAISTAKPLLISGLLFLSFLQVSAATYNPFIYFRF